MNCCTVSLPNDLKHSLCSAASPSICQPSYAGTPLAAAADKTSNGEQIKQTHGLRDTEWSTWTSPLGWPVQGIWPADADGATVNAVDRSHNKRLLAVADDFGDIRVYNYPCTDPAVSGFSHLLP